MLRRSLTATLVCLLSLCVCANMSAQKTHHQQAAGLYHALAAKIPHISPAALKKGLQAYQTAANLGIVKKPILTIVDYTKPATSPRLWVIDLKRQKVLFNEYVAHGKTSGYNVPHAFSNKRGSHASSLGTFLTGNTYKGKNGYSMRLQGLEKGINDNAFGRAIVMHGSRYVGASIIKRVGHIGRSWGCFAVANAVSHPIINRIKGGSLIVAYYPDNHWLNHSRFV